MLINSIHESVYHIFMCEIYLPSNDYIASPSTYYPFVKFSGLDF